MNFEDKILKELRENNNNEILKKKIINEVFKYLDDELEKKEINVEEISVFLLKLKEIMKKKEMMEEFEVIGNIYFLNESYMSKLVKSTNLNFLFLLRKFYAEASFLEFYLIVLKKMEGIITKNNLLELLGKEFINLDSQIKNYIEYLKDSDEYFDVLKGDIFYDVFWTVFQPFVKNIIIQKDNISLMKLLNFFEKMVESPDEYVEVLLRDTVIEGGWLEKNGILENYIKSFGDNFLILYALVYDGRIFLKNEDIWKEVKKRKLKI